jgi:hypothetical protein
VAVAVAALGGGTLWLHTPSPTVAVLAQPTAGPSASRSPVTESGAATPPVRRPVASQQASAPSSIPLVPTAKRAEPDTAGQASAAPPRSVGCAAPTVCITTDQTEPLSIKSSNQTIDGQGHTVPSISVEADHVTIEHFVVSGGSEVGIQVRGVGNVIQDNDISHIHYGTDDADAMRFFGDDTKILRNRVHDLVAGPMKGAHPDCAQTFATDGSGGGSSHFEFAGNHCEGPDGHGQCVMGEGPGSTDGGGGGPGHSQNWSIHDNYCATHSNQAIALRGIDNVTVKNNNFTRGTGTKAIQANDGSSSLVTKNNILGTGYGTLTGD